MRSTVSAVGIPRLQAGEDVKQQFYGRNPAVRYVDYETVRISLSAIAVIARKQNLPVHYPKIGAGLGNGDWQELSGIIDETLAGLDHTLWLPSPTPGAGPVHLAHPDHKPVLGGP